MTFHSKQSRVGCRLAAMILLWPLITGAVLCAQASPPPAADKTAPATAPSADDSTADLQKALQNPVASLISVPVQNRSNFSICPYDRTQDVVNIQPLVSRHSGC
jgi:hypothetical protein